ncbi:MAG: porin family protein [Boseongicola sp. SB0664_bin_43]|uniref:Porin family protein n=1 Tax=Boseongicola sp. SB0664_bin_43 TaxID=2604844 RepID=A0A6B0XXV6_9RHOB|nr:porin family protein [Boseongicola sp. SB0664_bin_43]
MNARGRGSIAGRPPARMLGVGRAATVRACPGHRRFGALAMPRGCLNALSRLATVTALASMSLCPGAAGADEFYLRGGLGLDWASDAAFTDIDCSSTVPAALYGCGTDRDGAPRRSLGDFGRIAVLELGLGYAPAGAMRYEILVEHRPRYGFEGRANFLAPDRQQSVAADVSSVSGMLAAFADFPELGSGGRAAITPYVGAGVGAVRNRIGMTTMTFPATTTSVRGGSRTDLAWMATAGVSVPLNERLGLDVAWRYTDLGEVHTGMGEGGVMWRDGSRDPIALDLAPTWARIRSHGLRVSLRYSF